MRQKLLKKNEQTGFTIIEVVLVLAIAGLIFLIVFLALPQLQRSRRDSQRKSDAGRLVAAINNYQSNNNGDIPENQTECNDVIDDYVKAGGTEEFRDPDGGDYFCAFNSGNDVINGPTEFGTNTLIQYTDEAICGSNGNPDTGSGSSRNYVVIVGVEEGSRYCQDNQ